MTFAEKINKLRGWILEIYSLLKVGKSIHKWGDIIFEGALGFHVPSCSFYKGNILRAIDNYFCEAQSVVQIH